MESLSPFQAACCFLNSASAVASSCPLDSSSSEDEEEEDDPSDEDPELFWLDELIADLVCYLEDDFFDSEPFLEACFGAADSSVWIVAWIGAGAWLE